ncbi:MAG TPA: DUF1993 domain-containing protein [Rhodospirillaceae bacterium]|nr:DUF1993 domain-containing protein [Rhodospirillaceae bacterium]
MSITMYQTAVPPVLQILTSLSALLDKAASYCQERKIEPSVLLNARLFPDMFPLTRQVQITTDQAKGMAARLAGIEVPSFADTEASFPELQARLEKTITFVKSVRADQIDGTENKTIHLKTPHIDLTFTGQQYLLNFVFPNFYFHATTAYNILRHSGVDVGKKDFLGSL